MSTKVAPRLTALDMYGITTYDKIHPSGVPEYPDLDAVQNDMDKVIREVDRDHWSRDLEDILEPLQDLKSKFGCDTDALDLYLEEASAVINHTKTQMIHAILALKETTGDTSLPDYVTSCIESAIESLNQALPAPSRYDVQKKYGMLSVNNFSRRMLEFLDSSGGNLLFTSDKSDPDDNKFVYHRGVMKVFWDGATLQVYWFGVLSVRITEDRILLARGKHSFEGDSFYGMFDDWCYPTDEEIKIFDMAYPNVPDDIWEILKFWRAKKKPIPDI